METNIIILLVYFQKGEKVSKGQNFMTFIGQAESKQLETSMFDLIHSDVFGLTLDP